MPEPALAFDTLRHRLRFSGQLVVLTGLRIGAGRDTDVTGHDLPVMRDASGRPFIPGASFKGVLRALLESLLRGLSDDAEIQRTTLACNVLDAARRCITDKEKEQLELDYRARPNDLAAAIIDRSCLICQTFGSTWLASHVAIRDLTVDGAQWFGQFDVRQGVALDRDTETAREGLLYSFETVPPGTRFSLEIAAENLQPWQQGLLWLGLQPLVRGEISIGGARSRGLGQVELLEGAWQEWRLDGQDTSRAARVVALLEGAYDDVDDAQKRGWQRALQDHVREVTGA
ncbi:MAG TPA: CRISPR-associated RAMP protein Csx7 [Herpetosiphonaceae bacterium]